MSSFEKAFRGKYTVLSKRIDVSHGLLNHLQDRGVLNSLQVGTCKVLLLLLLLLQYCCCCRAAFSILVTTNKQICKTYSASMLIVFRAIYIYIYIYI